MDNYNKYVNISIPRQLILNQKELNVNDEELLWIIKILSYNLRYVKYFELTSDFNIDNEKIKVLKEKNFINVVEIDSIIMIDLDYLFQKISNLESNGSSMNKFVDSNLSADAIDRINFLLNRNLKIHELEIIKEWLSEGYKIDEIEIAIQKSIINNVDNFSYIKKVLTTNSGAKKESNINLEQNIEFY